MQYYLKIPRKAIFYDIIFSMKKAHDIKIRHIKMLEIKKVVDLRHRSFKIPYKPNTFALKHIIRHKEHLQNAVQQIKSGGAKILVATKIDKIIGSIRYKILPNQKIFLFGLAILKRYRGRGIAKMLIEKVEEIGKKKKLLNITLECEQERGLPQYYKKLGFKVDKTKKHRDHHDVYMSKTLK